MSMRNDDRRRERRPRYPREQQPIRERATDQEIQKWISRQHGFRPRERVDSALQTAVRPLMNRGCAHYLCPSAGNRISLSRALFLCLIVLDLLAVAEAEKPPFYADKQDLLCYLDRHMERRPVRTRADWMKRRRHIVANMQLVMGPLPQINHKLPLRIDVLREVNTEKYTWRRITYVSEPGDRVPAYLYIPHGSTPCRCTAAIVSLHGSTYPRYIPGGELAMAHDKPPADPREGQYAQELAERGFVVIAPDYVFLSPDYKTDPYAIGYLSVGGPGNPDPVEE